MITVIGASGFTGGLVVELLGGAGLAMRLAGRNQQKLQSLAQRISLPTEIARLDARDRISLAKTISGSRVVINCAGPFSDSGIEVVKAAAEAGAHYLDVTGEQSFIARVINECGQLALDRNVCLVPACAFEYAIADAASAYLRSRLGELDEFSATYIISGFYTSRGTKRSVMRALAAPAYQLRGGRLVKIDPGEVSELVDADAGKLCKFRFPGGEVFLVPLHEKVASVNTYMTMSAPYMVLAALSRFGPFLARSPLAPALDFMIGRAGGDPLRHDQTRFKIVCSGSPRRIDQAFLTDGKRAGSLEGDQSAVVRIAGLDPYFLTARIVTRCATAIMEQPSSIPRGVVSAAMLRGYEFIKAITEEEGVVWQDG